MSTNKIILQSQGIKRALRNYKMYDSISEYIWNGFDAMATKVMVNLSKNEMGEVKSITIIDNGYGINLDTLQTKFKPVFESEKAIDKNSNKNTSTFHGKNGVGRLTFFNFSSNATWHTVYRDDNCNYKYSISINADNLEDFPNTDKIETKEEVGTKVEFINIDPKLMEDELMKYLQTEFCWYIELKKQRGCELIIDGKPLGYTEILEEVFEKPFKMDKQELYFDVKFCRWNKKLNDEFSKYYYINSNNEEVFKENTTLNNKGDKFFHSVYIKSKLFDKFYFKPNDGQVVLDSATKEDDEYKFIKKKVDALLREKRNPYIKQYTKTYLQELERNEAYPKYNKNNIIDTYRKDALDDLISNIYYAEPKIFTKLNIPQQKTFVRLFDLIIQSDEIENLFNIIDGIVDMTDEEREELSGILEYSTMSNITKTISLLKDRAKAVAYLKSLIFDEGVYANEVKHIQPFIEKHYWLFGEQYHLVTAEEPDFEEALRRFLYILRGEAKPKKEVKINHQHKQKEMDIFAVQQTKNGQIKKCVVVELKHPGITLKEAEFSQVKRYFDVIKSEPRFKADNIEWEFYLVGNKYNTEIESAIENAKPHGERCLAYKVKNCKIYIKTWSDIITEFEINHDFLMEKLELKQTKLIKNKNLTANEIVEEQVNNSAIMPPELAVV
jgi:hypothetical protein